MRSALIGYTGFVGGNLLRQNAFDDCFNSGNIGSIGQRPYDLVVCAAPSAVKWLANKHPEGDLEHVQRLVGNLGACDARRFVLISTVDVYPSPVRVVESSLIDASVSQPYGRHRYMLEESVRARFPGALIVRLPQLFGPGLKKNFVYDMIHDNALHMIDHRSSLQFYDVQQLWRHLSALLDHGIDVINLAPEPATCSQLAREVFRVEFDNETESGPVSYDLRSERLDYLGLRSAYVNDRLETFERMRRFVANHGTSPPA